MKFEQFNVQNFKGITSLNYNPKNKIAILVGENGKGKTSTLEAIRFLLTGNTPDNCIRDGADSTLVSAFIPGIGDVSREKFVDKPTKVKVNGKTTPAKNLDSMIETTSGVNKDSMKITTSAEVLHGLSAAEFSDFIMSHIPEQFDFQTICNYITGLTPEATNELAEFFPAMPAQFGMEMLNGAQDYFVELRKSLKKEIANREAKTKTFFGTKPLRTLTAIENELTELITADGSIETAKKAIQLYENAVQNKEKAEKDLESLREQINSIVATKPNPDNLKAIRDKIKYHEDEKLKAEKISQTIKNNIILFTTTIENLNNPVCPLSDKITCSTDKTAVREEFEDSLASNKEGLEIQKEIIAQHEAEIKKLKIAESEYNFNESRYNQKVVLNGRYETAKKALPIVPPKPKVIEIKDYKPDIDRVKKERDAFKAFEENEKLLNETIALKDRLDVIIFLIKALEPKGEVMTNITTHYLSFFEATINNRANQLGTGIKAKFVSNQGVNYHIQVNPSANFLPFDSLSHGEQTVAMFLLLDMINELCGAKILLIDDLNHLDPKSLDVLMELVTSPAVVDSYDHIFISSVNTTDMTNVIAKHTNDIDLLF